MLKMKAEKVAALSGTLLFLQWPNHIISPIHKLTHTHRDPPWRSFLCDFYLIETWVFQYICQCTVTKIFPQAVSESEEILQTTYHQTQASGLGFFSFQNSRKTHSVYSSELKMPASFFSLLRERWAFQHAAATSSRTKPSTSRTSDTTRVWGSVLKLKVTPLPATPMTSEMTPNGNTHRYQDSSVPPVAWAKRSRVDRSSTSLAPGVGIEPSRDRLRSGSGWAEAGGRQGKRPDEQPISLTPLASDPPPAGCFRSEHLPGKRDISGCDLYIELDEDRKSHAVVKCWEDRFTHFLSQAAMCSLFRWICWVSPACNSSTLSVLLAELTESTEQRGWEEPMRAEGLGGAVWLAAFLLMADGLRELHTRVLLMMLIYPQRMPPTFMSISCPLTLLLVLFL